MNKPEIPRHEFRVIFHDPQNKFSKTSYRDIPAHLFSTYNRKKQQPNAVVKEIIKLDEIEPYTSDDGSD